MKSNTVIGPIPMVINDVHLKNREVSVMKGGNNIDTKKRFVVIFKSYELVKLI